MTGTFVIQDILDKEAGNNPSSDIDATILIYGIKQV